MLARESAQLTAAFIKSIDRPGRFGDGRGSHGLSILAYANSKGGINKSWSQRILIDDRERTLGLGTYPLISLQKARDKAFDNARRIALGEDILKPKRIIPTLAQAFDQVIANRSPSWKGRHTAVSWLLAKHYCKLIHSKTVSDVTAQDVFNVLRPLWRDKGSTATSVQSRLSAVMKWAMQMEFRTSNPALAGNITEVFGPLPPTKPRPSAPYEALGQLLAKIRDSDAWWAEKNCLLFMAFTADRSGEVREATWQEIDLDEAIWRIPAERMKVHKDHIVPLPKQAVEILIHAKQNGHHSQGTVFPPKRGGTFISSGRLSELTRARDLHFVPHGLRSSFRTWAGERDDINQDTAEVSLAHAVGKKATRTYLRTAFFRQRRKLMQQWADYLSKTMGPVISS